MGGTAIHEYQALGCWAWQVIWEVVDTLELMADFLSEVLLAKDDVMWLVIRLRDNARDTGNMFAVNDAVVFLGKWMAEYAAHVRTVSLLGGKAGGEGEVRGEGIKEHVRGLGASLALYRARADARDGDLSRRGRDNVPPGGGGPGLGKRQYPGPEYRSPQTGAGYGEGQGLRPHPFGQWQKGDRFGYGVADGQARRCSDCLKRGQKAF